MRLLWKKAPAAQLDLLEVKPDAGSLQTLAASSTPAGAATEPPQLAQRVSTDILGLPLCIPIVLIDEELPKRSIERDADRSALRASTEQLATLSVDLQQFLQLLRRGSSEGVARYAERLQAVDVDLRVHISRASAFLADGHRGTSP